MTFKIIQETNNKNRFVLTIVPERFECKGVYWFPPSHWSTRKLNNVLRNPFATPDFNNWNARPCVVKRSNIANYTLAEEQEEELLNKTLTEVDDEADAESSEASESNTLTKKRVHNAARSPQADFSSIVEECFISELLENSEENQNQDQCATNYINLINNDVNQGEIPELIPNKNENDHQVQEATDVIVSILANQEKLSQQIADLTDIVTTGLAKLLTQGECLAQLRTHQFTTEAGQNHYEAAEAFEKICTGEQAFTFEDHLNNEEFKTEMIKKMTFVIGKRGKRSGEGWTCCYELLDLIFDRSFLTQCSWTGASTSNVEEGKIPFFKFKRLILLFATAAIEADQEFSVEKTKEFFKKILRNATRYQSQEMRQTRKSTKRVRRSIKKTDGKANSNSLTVENNIEGIMHTNHGA